MNKHNSKDTALFEKAMLSCTVPCKDSNTSLLSLIPLEKFPHGDLVSTRKDDQYDIEFYATKKGVQVLCYDEATGKSKFVTPAGWSIHRGKPVEVVELSNKKTIITDNDPRAIYGIAKDATSLTPCRFTPTQALEHKVSVPCFIGEFVENNSDEEFNEYDLWFDWDTGILIKDRGAIGNNHLVTKVDFEFGQFLGCLCGDGWWDKVDRDDSSNFYKSYNSKRAINLSDNEGDNAAFIEAYLKKICKNEVIVHFHEFTAEKYTGRFGDTVRYTYYGKDMHTIAEALTFLLGGEKDENTAGSGNKRMPSWLIGAPASARFGFLCGMISTDGAISLHKHEEDPNRKPQLLSNIASTSITLMRDISSMLNSLKIHNTVGFSKFTDRGNAAWYVSIAAAGLKKNEQHLLGMANKRKLAVLLAADVVEEYRVKSHVRVVFPDIVANVVLSFVKSHGSVNKSSMIDLANLVYTNASALYKDTYDRKKVGYVTPAHALKIVQFARQEHSLKVFALDSIKKYCEQLEVAGGLTKDLLEEDIINEMRGCLDILFPKQSVPQLYKKPLKETRMKLNEAAMLRRITPRSIQMIRSFVESIAIDYDLESNELFQEWVTKIVHGKFYWSMVTKVDKTGKVEELHDLTVPGYETYVNVDGVVLSNTINLHVPASDDAVNEAWTKLMPSSDPFSDRDQEKVMLLPKQEQILGLYTAATSDDPDTYEFDTEEEALNAIKRGEIPLSANVNIRNGVKMASADQNKEMKEAIEEKEKGAVRDPKTGKFMPTSNNNVGTAYTPADK